LNVGLGRALAACLFVNTLNRRWIFGEFTYGAARPDDEFTTAVGACAAKYRIGAGFAKRAFERTDSSLGGFRRQIFVATLAIGTQLKHRMFLAFSPIRLSCGLRQPANRRAAPTIAKWKARTDGSG
jgi:hypothetical protein